MSVSEALNELVSYSDEELDAEMAALQKRIELLKAIRGRKRRGAGESDNGGRQPTCGQSAPSREEVMTAVIGDVTANGPSSALDIRIRTMLHHKAIDRALRTGPFRENVKHGTWSLVQ